MLHVSMGALVSLVIILLICFVLPFALFYVLYRFADGRVKTFLIGAVAYVAVGVIADSMLQMLLESISKVSTNHLLYLLYAVILSPAAFIAINYLIVKRFGKETIKTTGDSMMYAFGYSTAFNVLSTGIIAIMYFLTMLDIRSRAESYIVVSDADYVSASETVSGTNLINESVYREMMLLCKQPVSYYMSFIITCLWSIAIYAAVMIVLCLAVKKSEKLILLAFVYVIRLFITLPDIIDHFSVIKRTWISYLVMAVILIVVWAAAIFCRKIFIDSEDAVDKKAGKAE